MKTTLMKLLLMIFMNGELITGVNLKIMKKVQNLYPVVIDGKIYYIKMKIANNNRNNIKFSFFLLLFYIIIFYYIL